MTNNLDEFNSTAKHIALQQISGAEGISLANADVLIFYNFGFSNVKFTQAIDRLTTMDRKVNDVYFIFEFKNEYILDSKSILFFTPDLSNYTNRYNLFNIEESSLGATGSASNQALSLITGQYIYKVYESATSSLILDIFLFPK